MDSLYRVQKCRILLLTFRYLGERNSQNFSCVMAHRLQMVNHTVSIQNSAAQSDFFDRKYFFDVCRIIPVSSWQSQ